MNQKSAGHKTKRESSHALDAAFNAAHGAVQYRMTNDYMFRAVLQVSNEALKGLICALLHLRPEDISSVEITNPIVLGETVDRKEFRLDINVLLNDSTFINLEMQLAGKLHWHDRSVSYACRSFDMLNHGQDYNDVQPVIHIGFLDYALFNDNPEFYATYKFMNIKKHYIYNDKLTISVVDLSHIELATDEDKKYHIDYWAKLFKADTWEEIKMLSSKDKYIEEASKSMFRLSAEDQIRKRCLDSEEFLLDMKAIDRQNREMEKVIANDKKIIAKDKEIIAEKDDEIKYLRALLKENGIDS